MIQFSAPLSSDFTIECSAVVVVVVVDKDRILCAEDDEVQDFGQSAVGVSAVLSSRGLRYSLFHLGLDEMR